jgi:DNA-binding PadR family transcriptional regulator
VGVLAAHDGSPRRAAYRVGDEGEVELRTAVLGTLGTANYDELTVEEVSKRIEGLPTEQLEKVREFEKKNKNREILIEQIDRKIRANENS